MAEYIDVVRTRRSTAPRSGRVERVMRIAGALFILGGVLLWVLPLMPGNRAAPMQRFALVYGF